MRHCTCRSRDRTRPPSLSDQNKPFQIKPTHALSPTGIVQDDEALHVLIEGPDEATVEKGQAMVASVLNPYSEDAVSQKEKQMRELAIINGTLKEEDGAVRVIYSIIYIDL